MTYLTAFNFQIKLIDPKQLIYITLILIITYRNHYLLHTVVDTINKSWQETSHHFMITFDKEKGTMSCDYVTGLKSTLWLNLISLCC